MHYGFENLKKKTEKELFRGFLRIKKENLKEKKNVYSIRKLIVVKFHVLHLENQMKNASHEMN